MLKLFEVKKKEFGYPECDHLNIALRLLLRDYENNKSAIEEIYHAIIKTNGYFYEDIKKQLQEKGYFIDDKRVH